MTTSIRINPHGHTVKVTELHKLQGREPREVEHVIGPNHDERTFYAHSSLDLRIEEMPPEG